MEREDDGFTFWHLGDIDVNGGVWKKFRVGASCVSETHKFLNGRASQHFNTAALKMMDDDEAERQMPL